MGDDATTYVRFRGRVSGPFTQTQLKRMIQRGQITRSHELSGDQRAWLLAGERAEFFPPAAAPHILPGKPALKAVPEVRDGQTPTTSTDEVVDPQAVSAQEADWYYSNGTEKLGPFTAGALALMVQTGQLSTTTLVWRPGMAKWQEVGATNWGARPRTNDAAGAEASSHANAPASTLRINSSAGPAAMQRKMGLRGPMIGALLVLGAIAIVILLMLTRGGRSLQLPGRATVSDIHDDAHVAKAVCFVVAGVNVIEPEGRESELPYDGGSGFFISPSGYLITNRHVIERVANLMKAKALKERIRSELLIEWAPRIWVFCKGTKYVAIPAYVSSKFDLAILKIDRKDGAYFALSSAGAAQRGQVVCALGFPGIAMAPVSTEEAVFAQVKSLKTTADADIAQSFKDRDFEFTLTTGVVSRTYQEAGGRGWIQHEAMIRSGNSGGPLVTAGGLVLGINTERQVEEGSNEASTNIALEISQLRNEICEHVPDTTWR